MTEIKNGLHIIDGLTIPSSSSLRNVTAIIESDESITLIDCGEAGSSDKILGYLAKYVKNPFNVRHLILTHFDQDHVGAAPELIEKTKCQTLAPSFDAKVMQGKRFELEELKNILPDYTASELDALQRKIGHLQNKSFHVDRILQNGDSLPLGGGARVVQVSGHTPGHVVLFLPKYSTLVAGDTLDTNKGEVVSPSSIYTVSMRLANKSLHNLVEFDFDILIPYHSPPLMSNGSKALRRYLGVR